MIEDTAGEWKLVSVITSTLDPQWIPHHFHTESLKPTDITLLQLTRYARIAHHFDAIATTVQRMNGLQINLMEQPPISNIL